MAGTDRDRDNEQLLPWLANETLEGEEARAAEALAKDSPAAARDLEFMRGLRAQMKTLESGNSPGELGWRRLQQQIARERRPAMRGGGWRTIAAIAAALVILLQAAVIFHQWQGGDVVPAGGEGATLQVRFAPTASETAIREILQEIDGTIVDGPGAIGVYHLRIEGAAEDPALAAKALEILRGRPDVVLQAEEEAP
jgi:anti-sigma-K factor RskA